MPASVSSVSWNDIITICGKLPDRNNLSRTILNSSTLFDQRIFRQGNDFCFLQTDPISNSTLSLSFDQRPGCQILYADRDWLKPHDGSLVPYTYGANVSNDEIANFSELKDFVVKDIPEGPWWNNNCGTFSHHFEAAFIALNGLKANGTEGWSN